MWQHFLSPLANQGGEEIQFDSFAGYYADVEDDASTYSEHASTEALPAGFAGDASMFSEHAVYYSSWDTGTSRLRKPTSGAVAKCKDLLRRVGCGRLLMEIFAGAFILTALATSAGWPCSTPIDVIHDGLDLTCM